MILTLNKEESATLTLHMAIMRDTIKKFLKKKYKEKQKEYLASYDYVHSEAKKALESSAIGFTHYTLNMNIQDLFILNEFLRAYTNKIEQEELEKHLKNDDKEQLKVLNKLLSNTNKMIQEDLN